jgi:antitoxin HicB
MVATAPNTIRTIDEYMRLPYRMDVYWDETYWAAEFPELPGLVAGGETWDELHAMIEDAKRAWFASMLEDNLPIPEPRPREDTYSGKFLVRVPKSLHRRAAEMAADEGVSLNTFVVSAVSAALGR